MKHPKVIAITFTIFLILVASFFIVHETNWNKTVSLSVTISSQEGYEENLFCWKDDTSIDNYYIFLPSYANLSESVIRTYNTTFCTVTLNDKKINKELVLNDFCLDVPYPLLYQYKGELYSYTLTFVQSANISTMYIDTASGNMEYIHEAKGNKETGSVTVYTSDGKLDFSGTLDFIKGRGNSTWTWPKKPYNIKLSQEANLLNMGKAQQWVLLSDYRDSSFSKNKITYDFAKSVGLSYTPDCDWIDLYLNGKYAGLYLLCEHINIHPERVNIDKDNSFLVTIEGLGRLQTQNHPYIELSDDIALRIRHAGMPVEELQSLWLSAQNAILSKDGIDPISHKSWYELIDLDSWVLRYLMDEVFANYDGGYISQYFYYDGNNSPEKIYAGPVWDMDLTLGCYGYPWQTASPYTILAGRPHMKQSTDAPLFHALCQKDLFIDRVSVIYKTIFLPKLSHLLTTELEVYEKKVKNAAEMDYIIWHTNEFSEYEGYISFNRNYLTERIQFLNDLWLNNEKYYFVQANASDGSVWGCFALKPGEYLPDMIQKEGWSWFQYGNDLPFDINQPIHNNVSIYLAPEAATNTYNN